MTRRKISRKMVASKKHASSREKKEIQLNTSSKENKSSPKKLSFMSHMNPIVASIIIVYIIIIIVYFFQSNNQQTIQESLLQDKQLIINQLSNVNISQENTALSNSGFAFIAGNTIDIEKLRNFAEKNYSDIKKELNLQNDFCIHFEDENGNAIDISPITGRSGVGIGSSRLKFTIVNNAGENTETISC